MWAVLVLLMNVIVRGCDTDAECNAGICVGLNPSIKMCFCCDTTYENDVCGGNMPGSWTGSTCEHVKHYSGASWSYHILSDNVTCANDGSSSSVPDLVIQTESLTGAYTGVIKNMPCKSCTPGDLCDAYDSGILVQFRTDFNTYYDSSCLDYPTTCNANWDYGATAYMKFEDVFFEGEQDFITNLGTLLESTGTNGLGWSGTVTSLSAETVQVTVADEFYAIMETDMCDV